MGIANWLRIVFAPSGRDDDAAEREEFGLADPAEADLKKAGLARPFAIGGAEAAEAELDSFKAPRDPNP